MARLKPINDTRTFNGWHILFNEPFTTRYGDLSARVRDLKRSLTAEEYGRHPDVKLFSALYRIVYEIVPENPDHADFRLRGDLKKFRRVKGKGLPRRYRLFFMYMESAKAIIFLYVNDERSMRKQGDDDDPYERFAVLVRLGRVSADFERN